jgi:hypothetical protein
VPPTAKRRSPHGLARSDYASYLTRNNNSIKALIDAMRQQIAQNG